MGAVALASGLVDALKIALPDLASAIKRNYLPRFDRSEFVDDQLYVTVYMETLHTVENRARDADLKEFAFGVAIQKAMPIGAAVDDPAGLVFCDSMIALQQRFEALWSGSESSVGSLRFERIGDYEFVQLVESPLYEPIHLVEQGVFTSVIIPKYKGEG